MERCSTSAHRIGRRTSTRRLSAGITQCPCQAQRTAVIMSSGPSKCRKVSNAQSLPSPSGQHHDCHANVPLSNFIFTTHSFVFAFVCACVCACVYACLYISSSFSLFSSLSLSLSSHLFLLSSLLTSSHSSFSVPRHSFHDARQLCGFHPCAGVHGPRPGAV